MHGSPFVPSDTCPRESGGDGGGHGDGVMALVGVFAAIGGIITGVLLAGAVFVYLSRTLIQRWKQSAYGKVN